MTITATFSNGHTDTYKGKRDVKAAWMVVLPSGKILSGHSMDSDKAEKTARNNASDRAGTGEVLKTGAVPAGYMAYRDSCVKDAGFKTVKEYNADIKAKRAEFVAKCKIEVVAL